MKENIDRAMAELGGKLVRFTPESSYVQFTLAGKLTDKMQIAERKSLVETVFRSHDLLPEGIAHENGNIFHANLSPMPPRFPTRAEAREPPRPQRRR